MLEFDFFRLLVIILSTLLAYLIASKKMESRQKILLLFCFAFLFIYSGAGGALKSTNPDYTFFYVSYIFILAITIRVSSFSVDYKRDNIPLTNFVDRQGDKFIFVYFALILATFIYPEFKLKNLISPPPPILAGFDFEEEGNNYSGGAISSLIYFLRSFILPFFYISLYKYRNKAHKIVLFLIMDLYLIYCKSGYVGRGTILQTAIIIFFVVYYRLSKRWRKRLILSICAIIPFALFGFYRYSLVRMGTDITDESLSQAVQILFGQEIGYPQHYDYYIKLKEHHIFEYLSWFILLPLPGFLKFGYGNYFLNREFSMEVLGLDPSDSSFFVVLPGVVGEGIYVFGPHLFLLHTILLGVFIKFILKTFTSSPIFSYFYLYCIVSFSFMLARAGTISVYPIMLKSSLILVVVFYFVKKKMRKYK